MYIITLIICGGEDDIQCKVIVTVSDILFLQNFSRSWKEDFKKYDVMSPGGDRAGGK